MNTVIRGGADNLILGEEIVGGLDLDGNGMTELFVGDFLADGSASRTKPLSGIGYVFYDAYAMKGLSFNLDTLPPGLALVRILGLSITKVYPPPRHQGNSPILGDIIISSLSGFVGFGWENFSQPVSSLEV